MRNGKRSEKARARRAAISRQKRQLRARAIAQLVAEQRADKNRDWQLTQARSATTKTTRLGGDQ